MGILICGLNGTGKSTLGRKLADRIGYQFIDSEELFFPDKDSLGDFFNPLSKEQAIQLLENRISNEDHFVFASVKGGYGAVLISKLTNIILIDVPKQIRNQRVWERSYQKFGERILPGGDLLDSENGWFKKVESRPEDYVTTWLETVGCPVIEIDGTQPIEKNIDYLTNLLCADRVEKSDQG